MKEQTGCKLGLFNIIGLILLGLVSAVVIFSAVAGSFGREFAKGGGQIEVLSDDIQANNFGDGVAVAAKDSEIHVENTVNQRENAKSQDAVYSAFCGLTIVALLIFGVVGLWVNSNTPHYD